MKSTFTSQLIMSACIVFLLISPASAQEEIWKDGWTAHAFRYQADNPKENAIDGYTETKFGMGGSASEGRWFMIDLGESHDVVKFTMTYVPGEQWKNNFILGFDLYVTNYEYPVRPASGPKGSADDGDFFVSYPDSITARIVYPEATEHVELEFPATNGRYVWIVSNGPTGEWWEIHEISLYKEEKAVEEFSKEFWTAHAIRYQADNPKSNAIDGNLDSKFGMGGSASEGRWFMIDMGESQQVTKVNITYVPGEQWRNNFILGFDLYVTDYEYPVRPAQGPKGTADDGDLFVAYPDSVTAKIEYPNATESQDVEFPATKGRYIWIVSNGPTGEWWEIHEISVFGIKSDESGTTSIRETPASGFVVYPNPVNGNGQLTVHVENITGNDLMISDLAGRVVYRTNLLMPGDNTIDISLKAGVYIISIPGKQAQKLLVR